MFVGYFGFFGGLFLAVLGFEPTTSNGTKLWLISGGVTLFGMAGAGLTEWIKKLGSDITPTHFAMAERL